MVRSVSGYCDKVIYGIGSLNSQWGSTIKTPCVPTVTSHSPSWYDLACRQDITLEQTMTWTTHFYIEYGYMKGSMQVPLFFSNRPLGIALVYMFPTGAAWLHRRNLLTHRACTPLGKPEVRRWYQGRTLLPIVSDWDPCLLNIHPFPPSGILSLSMESLSLLTEGDVCVFMYVCLCVEKKGAVVRGEMR